MKLIVAYEENKKSGAFRKKTGEEELKKNEGAILKFVKMLLPKKQKRLAATVNRCPKLRRKEKQKLEQNNNEVIIERSPPMNETLSDKDKTGDNYYSHNDVATWPEVLTHNMRVEMIKLGREKF